jgi:hypothetical protein
VATGGSRWRSRRPGWGALLLVALGGLVACSGAQASPKRPAGSAAVSAVAQAAGGACQLFDFEGVAQTLGVRFDTAAAAQQGETFSCVLGQDAASYPDLTLAVTPTTVDPLVYRAAVQPRGAVAVPDLGRIGYSRPVRALGADSGPGVEVGWLAGNGRLITLQFRFAPKATDADVAALTPNLIALARLIEESSL